MARDAAHLESLETEAEPLLTSPNVEEDSLENREELERSLVRKLDRRMSILVLIYILNYIDRNNASAARLRGFEEDLHLEGNQFATVLSVLYIGYIMMQIPSNMFLNYFGKPSVYLPVCMTIWGGLSVCTGFTTTYFGVLCIRFFLGFVEAAFFPGALFLISKWYTRHELSQRTALLTSGNLLSNAFGSLIASGILDSMDGVLGFTGWRWLFFVEGTVTILVAIWSITILPDFPETSSGWLTPAEKALAIQRMAEDIGHREDIPEQSTKGSLGRWPGLYLAVTDLKVWWLAIALLFMCVSLSFHAYFPTLSATMGYGTTVSLLLCAPPWLFATAAALALSRHSDMVGERSEHIALSLFIGIVGFVMAMSTMNTGVRYVSLFLMAQTYGGFICFLAWASGSVSDTPAKRAVALALINCVSQFGNVIGSYVWPTSWGPTYNMSYTICIFMSSLSITLTIAFRVYLSWQNHDADKSEGDECQIQSDMVTGMSAATSKTLTDWSFTQIGGGDGTKDREWLQVSSFPTTVHVELLKLKKIPDPFIGLHEWDVQWVGEADWAFKTTISVSEEELAVPKVDLVFDGLDTFATVRLNGKVILQTDNQFIAHRVPVKSDLRVGDNELLLHFESAFLKGRDIEKGHEKYVLWNGDSSRLHVRKAQYNYGWDWGPILMTIGPWKPIKLETYKTRIMDLDIRTLVSETLDVNLTANIAFSDEYPGFASFTLKKPNGSVEIASEKIPISSGTAKVYFQWKAGELQLWYPVGYGAQPLYTVEVVLFDPNGTVLDKKAHTTAFRRAVIVQDKLLGQDGLTFLFEINNVRIFCGGSNWIPADSFLTTMTTERYRAWLQLMVDGNQNMVRVWGGGIYEHDDFYDVCDELGLLVWQDFMFGCGQYPAYDSFVESVREEAIQNVKRLRHHASVVIFAGNNEDYQVAESFNLELDYSDETSDFRNTTFPARYIYERVLPAVVNEHSDVYYHRGSPYSGFGRPTTDRTYGDIHQWNVWHGSQEPWHNWDILSGRFVSEFGMQGYPNIRTVDYWLGGNKAERFPQSRSNTNHNKADGFERRIELYLVENFKHSFEIESYVYYTQIMQAETLASAYRLWRRNWGGRGKEYTAGALVWQINDCWPVTSWAIVDYFLRPKPAFFTIARELRPFTVGMTRKEKKTFTDDRSAANFTITTVLEIWGTNSSLSDKTVTLEVTSFDLESDWIDKWEKEISLAANASTELHSGKLAGQPDRTKLSEVPKTIIVSARLLDNESVLARYSNWPEPFKFIHYPPIENLGLKVEVGADGESVTLSTKKPIKGIVLDVEGDEIKWSDQAIDLVPGDPQTVQAVGLKGRDVKVRFLGDGTA